VVDNLDRHALLSLSGRGLIVDVAGSWKEDAMWRVAIYAREMPNLIADRRRPWLPDPREATTVACAMTMQVQALTGNWCLPSGLYEGPRSQIRPYGAH
jgi:hypothetical protein